MRIQKINKLLTRKEVITIWKKQPEEMLNLYVCPNCRDLLESQKMKNMYYCRFCDLFFKLN